MAGDVLVATVEQPGRRFRVSQEKFDADNAAAKEAGEDSPYIVQDDEAEGGKSFDQLAPAEQADATKEQAERVAAKEEEDEE